MRLTATGGIDIDVDKCDVADEMRREMRRAHCVVAVWGTVREPVRGSTVNNHATRAWCVAWSVLEHRYR